MNLAQKIKNLDTADVVTLGVGLALVLSDIFLTNKVRVGVATEDGGNCPPGFVYDSTTYTCVAQAPAATATTATSSTKNATSSSTTSTPVTTVSSTATTATGSGLSFSGTITNVSNNLTWLTGSGSSIFAGGTSAGCGMPYWSGEITYSGGAFSGSLSLNGTPVIVGQGNSIVGIGSTATVNGTTGSYAGTIIYSGGVFSGSIYVSVNGGSPTPVLSGNELYLMGNAGANSTGFAGVIQATTGTGNVAATLTSAITKLTSLVTQTVQAGAFASFSNWSNSSSGQHTSAAASVSYSNGAIVISAGENSNYGGCGGSWNGNATVQVGNNNLIVSTSGMLSSSGSIGINENGFTGGSISINDTGVPNCARRNISFNFSVVSPMVLNINVGGGTSGGNLAGQIQVALKTATTQVCPSGYTDVNGNCLS